MRKINILPKSVYNRIAAGEVVDRPYSAVKELVENSIDAGATEIEIYIERGGKDLIKVIDNGCGIEKDDLKAAFLPHATSKVAEVADLDNISTLGFRGEALASISAVAKVEIISATAGNQAYKLSCEGGKLGQIEPAASLIGTVICVRELFYNTPAREKFLKQDKKEEADITSFVSRYILSRPNIRFKYYADGKPILQSFGGGLEEAIAQVYGAKTLSECIKINAEKDNIKIYGYIGNQNFFKSNKSYQSAFINGRYVINNTVATAISNAYASYAMKRQFPFYILNIDVPSDILDVNVHPNKADVRFVDNRMIFGIIFKVVSSVLDGTANAENYVVNSGRIPEIQSLMGDKTEKNKVYSYREYEKRQSLIDKYMPEKSYSAPENGLKTPPKSVPEIPVDKKSGEPEKFFNPETDMSFNEFYHYSTKGYGSFSGEDAAVSDNSLSKFTIEEPSELEKRIIERKQQEIDYETCIYRGSLFNTYLIYEYRNVVYIIDQHAAHERLIFDRLKKRLSERTVNRQPVMFPYVIDTNAEETQFILKNINILNDFGFLIEQFGANAFRVCEIPADLCNLNIKDFFEDILASISDFKDIKIEDLFKDKLAMTACKHAVKGGMQLTDGEVDALFKMMEGNVNLKCPHGRPVCVTFSKREIEKLFKRIV